MVQLFEEDVEGKTLLIKRDPFSLDDLVGYVSRQRRVPQHIDGVREYMSEIPDKKPESTDEQPTVPGDDTAIPSQVIPHPRFTNDLHDLFADAGLVLDEDTLIYVQTALTEVLSNNAFYGSGGAFQEIELGLMKCTGKNHLYIGVESEGVCPDPEKIRVVDYGAFIDQGLLPVDDGGHLHIGFFLANAYSELLALGSYVGEDQPPHLLTIMMIPL
jgi:hypothetical protein